MITKKVNESHFKSSIWNGYFNISETINPEQQSTQEFPNVVTSTVDGKLKNKHKNAKAICICKVGNVKLYVFFGLMFTTVFSIVVFTIVVFN